MSNQLPVFKVKANEFIFGLDPSTIQAADLVTIAPGVFHMIHQHRSVTIHLVQQDAAGKKMRLEIDGEQFDIEIKDELDQMLDQMGFNNVSTRVMKEVKAPMPGLVLEVNVKEGQTVAEGDKLLILGAMKMENSILAHANAKIKKVAVSAGQAVDKGQVLIELE